VIEGVVPSAASLSDTVAPTAWTPVDASGAGLTFSAVTAIFTKVGHIVTVMVELTYPITGSTAAAKIGGLPVALSSSAPAIQTVVGVGSVGGGGTATALVAAAGTTVEFSSTAVLTNNDFSGAIVSLTLNYISN
jgi:hypothetical protein